VKLAIYGAGAIGAYLGIELALGGVDVSLIGRGPHLAAMKANGARLRVGGSEKVAHPRCTEEPAELEPQDVVIIALKAHSVPAICARLQPLLGPQTAVVTAVNGIPWWYFYRLKGAYENRRVRAVDPDDVQWTRIGPERALGCVIYPAAEIVAPGVVEVQPHLSSNRLPIGEPSGERTARAEALSKALIATGFKSPVRPDIRTDIWVKLWGNLAFNPISALTTSTLVDLVRDPGTRAVARAMMVEGAQIAEALGVRFPIGVDARIKGAEEVGAHRTSMLQDLTLGRPMEIDALVLAVAELGDLVGIETPAIDTVYALVRRRAIEAGCYPGGR
jgi:2-dehydropantoate 2-reductase